MKKFLVLLLISSSVLAADKFEDIIFKAISDNPNGFFEDRSSGRKNLPMKKDSNGKFALTIETSESGGKNLVSGLLTSLGSISDDNAIKKTDHKKYGEVDFTFLDEKGKKHKVNCSVTQEYQCGRISLIGCFSKSGAVVGPSGPDHNFRFIYDEQLASDEQCYPQIVHDRRERRRVQKDKISSEQVIRPSKSKTK